MFEEKLYHRKLNPQKLKDYGFKKNGVAYEYRTSVLDGSFTLFIAISQDGAIDTRLEEQPSGEEYVLYKTDAVGSFVGKVRSAISDVIEDIAQRCFDTAVFKSLQTEAVIEYIRRKYGDELEFLWDKLPDAAIWRRKDTGKWYGIVMTIAAKRLGLDYDSRVEVMDLHIDPDKMDDLLKKPNYLPGYHMNKKHWFSVILDGSVSNNELFSRIDESYTLAKKK